MVLTLLAIDGVLSALAAAFFLPLRIGAVPFPISALLSGVLSKVAAYGFLRGVLPSVPEACEENDTLLQPCALPSEVATTTAAQVTRSTLRPGRRAARSGVKTTYIATTNADLTVLTNEHVIHETGTLSVVLENGDELRARLHARLDAADPHLVPGPR